jgi:hypothetical protein
MPIGAAVLAEVRRLRRAGHRLARDEVVASAPLRGDLVVFKRSDPWRGGAVPVAALLGDDQVSYLLPPLDQVRIARWRGCDLLLVGLEDLSRRSAGGAPSLQSWWVRLLLSDPAPPRNVPPAPGG